MSQFTPHDEHVDRILQAIDENETISQRSLASDLGIALGLTNLLVRGLVSRGLVRVSRVHPRRLRYLLTPAGVVEKARMSRLALASAVERYGLARHRLRTAFRDLSARWPGPGDQAKRVAFLGTGEVAEIGFICLQETDLALVAVVDDQGKERFFDIPIIPDGAFVPGCLAGPGADVVIVMSLKETDRLQDQIARAGVPDDRVIWP